jgi:CheY-like chemotaxis protein
MDSISKTSRVVLVVEDDTMLRTLAIDIVEEAGFTAVAACDADEAILLLQSRNDIVLLFTDVNMPGSMDGLKLAHAVRDRWPPLKILIVSSLVRLQPSELPSDSHFFGKPYRTTEMIAILQTLVGVAEA